MINRGRVAGGIKWNQADSPQAVSAARSLVERLLQCGIERVDITSYATNEPIKEVLHQ